MGAEAHAFLQAISVIEIPLFYEVLDPMSISDAGLDALAEVLPSPLTPRGLVRRSTPDSSFVSTGPCDGSADSPTQA